MDGLPVPGHRHQGDWSMGTEQLPWQPPQQAMQMMPRPKQGTKRGEPWLQLGFASAGLGLTVDCLVFRDV